MIELLTAFVIAAAAIFLLISVAPKLGLVDIPNERSVHVNAVPRGAGIGIFLAFLLTCCLFDLPLLEQYPLTFVAFALVFGIGVFDDFKGTYPKTKFIVIFIATTLAFFEGIGIHSLGTYFGFEANLGWMALPFSLFALSGFTNALNLIDGLDGLAGSISLIILAALLAVGYRHHDAFIVHIAAISIAAVAAFLLFNWHPARIFMGDSGSLTLGFIISVLSVKALDYLHPSVIFFLAAVPVIDTLVVMIRRKRRNRSMFAPDKTHLHHILLNFFDGNVKRTVLTLAVIQLIYSLTALMMMKSIEETFVVLLFGANVTLVYIVTSTMLSNQERLQALRDEINMLRRNKYR